MDLDGRTTYRGLLNLADEYLSACKILNDKDPRIQYLFHVKFYLLAHAIELAFKSYLRFKGCSTSELKNMSHDLLKIYKELSSRYVYRLDSRALEMIENINPYYKNKQFEYPVVGTKDVVEIKDLAVVVGLIIQSTQLQITTEEKA